MRKIAHLPAHCTNGHLLSWLRHQMEACSALLAFCAGNSPVTGEFAAQRPVTRSFDVIFDLRLNKWLSKQWEGGDLRRHRAHYDVTVMWHFKRDYHWLDHIKPFNQCCLSINEFIWPILQIQYWKCQSLKRSCKLHKKFHPHFHKWINHFRTDTYQTTCCERWVKHMRMRTESMADKYDKQHPGGYFGKYQCAHYTTAICFVCLESVPNVTSNQLLYVKWMSKCGLLQQLWGIDRKLTKHDTPVSAQKDHQDRTCIFYFLRDTMSPKGPTIKKHDNVIKWKHFPRYWSFVRGIHRSPVNSPHKGQ